MDHALVWGAGGADSGDEVHVNLNGDQVAGAAPTSGSVGEAAREAKLLEMVQANAEKKMECPIKKCVVTVPAHFTTA